MPFSSARLVLAGTRYHRAIALAVALGVAAATAVVCGALLVGDSMRGSLRALTLQRLGAIDAAVIPGTYFHADRVSSELPPEIRTVPVIQFSRGVVEAGDANEGGVRRAGAVQILASGPEFWDLDTSGVRPDPLPSGDAVVLNQRAADELGVTVGDVVTVRLPTEQAVPADSPLGRGESTSEGIPRLEVVAIVPDQGLGRFSLQPSQAAPLCAFLPIELVRDTLDRPDAANALLIDWGDQERTSQEMVELAEQLRPGLEDYGLQLSRVTQTFGEDPPETVFDYYSLTSERLLLSPVIVDAVRERLGESQTQPVLTYLANAISLTTIDRQPTGDPADGEDAGGDDADGETVTSIPYSTISAVDSSESLPLEYGAPANTQSAEGAPADAPVPLVLNSWAAERLGAQVGTPLRVTYFEPESRGGREVERAFDATVTGVVPITEPSSPYGRRRDAEFDQPPTVYNDPDLTPTVPGVTDQESINDWDLPFALDNDRITRADDDYWNNHRLTPKAFLPLADGRRLFGSRFGDTTSLRIDASVAESTEALAPILNDALREAQVALGFAVVPIRAQQLAASRGTTPFDGLFLALSFFVIAAALMLVALLFRLGLEQRASEYGVMLAVGIPGRRVARLALAEGALVALPGAALGVAGGIGYAMFVLWALRSWWVGAVTVPFLSFHWTVTSLVAGFAAGVLMATATILLTARRLRRVEVRPLLAGRIPAPPRRRFGGRWLGMAAIVAVVLAVGLGVYATRLSGPAQAGAFVGGGMLLLCGLLAGAYVRLSSWHQNDRRGALGPGYSMRTLALRSIGRNPLRSTLSIGLMAVACFLIVSMSAFQMRPTDSGVGGFDLMGQSAVPLYEDLGDTAVRANLLGRDASVAADARVFGLRYRPGQDASCNNLYQASQPQVLGIPASLADWYAHPPADSAIEPVPFEWADRGAADGAGTTDAAPSEAPTPWHLLAAPARGTAEDPVPVILDQNTALWSLQMRGGVGEVRGFTFDDGRTRYFRVVALLANSVLQGGLIVGEGNFETLFPEISGYSYFLVAAAPSTDPNRLAEVFENRLGDVGMDMVPTREVLAGLLAVQNTYLRTFQSLGALGLLLGTFGLAVVQLRSVLERRGELTLMRALGFSRRALGWSVMLENTSLLLAGILCGAGAALAAVVPYFVTGGIRPSLIEPLAMLAAVLVVGLIAGSFAVRRVLRMPLLAGL